MDVSWLPDKGQRKRVDPSQRKSRKATHCPPGHCILDRPEILLSRQKTFGVWEMDTVHSCRGGKGSVENFNSQLRRQKFGSLEAWTSGSVVEHRPTLPGNPRNPLTDSFQTSASASKRENSAMR